MCRMLTTLALSFLAPDLAGRVLVVENSASPASVEIAAAYRKVRNIKNRCIVDCPDSAQNASNETIVYADFQQKVEAPIRDALRDKPWIDFIVLTKGIPIRVAGAPHGVNNDRPSLDSTLAAMGYSTRKDVNPIVVNETGFKGKCWANKFWNSKERFSHEKFGGYLVTRLDGYTTSDVYILISSAQKAERSAPIGSFLLDMAHTPGDVTKVPLSPAPKVDLEPQPMTDMAYNEWDADLKVAGEALKKDGLKVTLDEAPAMVGFRQDVMGYASWGSNDGAFVAKKYQSIMFAPGGIAETAVSTSARTFLPTTGGQSLIADLIHNNAAGVKGYCDEPFLEAIASPSILFDRYTKGWTLAESFYAASRYVGWEDIVVGDPLCTPYRSAPNAVKH